MAVLLQAKMILFEKRLVSTASNLQQQIILKEMSICLTSFLLFNQHTEKMLRYLANQ